jgi:hypothetical protein
VVAARNWYVLWRPPLRREHAYDYYGEVGGPVTYGEWEIYQQGLSRIAAERLARRVEMVLSPRMFGVNVATKVGQGAPPKLNPPWTTRAIAKEWDHLSKKVGPEWMPVLSEPHASRKGDLIATLDTLGCGAYGCVLETSDPSVVLKITTDASEAEFAMQVLPRTSEEAQDGFVRYLDATELAAHHERRPLYALWRQSAEKVGQIGAAKGIADRLVGRSRKSLLRLVAHSWESAQVALALLVEADDYAGELYGEALLAPRWEYDSVRDWSRVGDEMEDIEDDGERLGAALSYFQAVNRAMDGTPLGRVGRALNALLADGIFVADVHEGNLGMVDGAWVITDPGNAVILPQPWR